MLGGATNFTFTPSTGDVAISAPVSGNALTVTGAAGSLAVNLVGSSTTGSSFGLGINAGTSASDYSLLITNRSASANYLEIFGDGGVTVGSPTSGDKGLGSINAQSMFVQGVPVVTGAGSNQQIASVVGICSSGGCTAVNAKGISTSITRNSAGNYTVSFSPGFSAQPACVASADGTAGGIGTVTLGGTASATVVTYVAAVATDMSWSLVCTG